MSGRLPHPPEVPYEELDLGRDHAIGLDVRTDPRPRIVLHFDVMAPTLTPAQARELARMLERGADAADDPTLPFGEATS